MLKFKKVTAYPGTACCECERALEGEALLGYVGGHPKLVCSQACVDRIDARHYIYLATHASVGRTIPQRPKAPVIGRRN